jgi:hypothetical protein
MSALDVHYGAVSPSEVFVAKLCSSAANEPGALAVSGGGSGGSPPVDARPQNVMTGRTACYDTARIQLHCACYNEKQQSQHTATKAAAMNAPAGSP